MLSAIKGFPQFALGVSLGLLKAALSEVEVFLLFAFGILLSFATDPLIGATAALGYYIAFRMLSQYAMLFSTKFDQIGMLLINRSKP